MDSNLLAYLAGVIDSDGSIGIKRSTYAMRHGNGGQATYSERVMCRQVTPDAIVLLRDIFGGYYGMTAASTPRGKPLHSWQVTDLRAAACLKALRPFLRVKAAQADNALALRVVKNASKAARVPLGRGHVGAIVRPEAFGLEMERLLAVAHELNSTGTPA
jgi:hypothetical protein